SVFQDEHCEPYTRGTLSHDHGLGLFYKRWGAEGRRFSMIRPILQ
ncbi:hypothetical protein KIPB_013957, partial [Kipferlia bialata]